MRKKLIGLAAVLALGVFAPAQAIGSPAQGPVQSRAVTCPDYYACLLNCPFKYTDPGLCDFICQAEVCRAA